MKDKKKLFIIIGSIVILLAVILGVCIIFLNDSDKKNDTKPSEENNVSDKMVAPASNTEELLQELETVEVTNVTEDEIVFSNDVKLEKNEKVAVWIYSEPKFLGFFDVLVENGMKKIVGLKEALENITIEAGKHNIALTKESGENIGYIDVYVKDDGKLSENEEVEEKEEEKIEEEIKEEEKKQETSTEKPVNKTITKKVTETVEINYETVKENEVNMKKGTTATVKEGQKGQKEITYKVTYDSNGKEMSREKISEKITKEPVNKIEKIGASEFNMNKDMLYEVSWGPMCTELNADNECDTGTLQYESIKINYTEYITSIKDNGNVKFSGLLKSSGSDGINLVATWNGTKYYFYKSAGGGMYELLTEETCSKYNLSCGRW